jgi:hypothetical protein
MTTYHSTADRAPPVRCLLFQKYFDAILLHELEVLYHAHVIESAIALVECLQPAAGKIVAVVAEPHKSLPQQLTVPFVVTILVAW